MNRLKLSKQAIVNALFATFLFFAPNNLEAQHKTSVYTVQKGETVYAIAKKHGITIQQLTDANPVMKQADFVLKDGAQVNIPDNNAIVAERKIVVGVMLPLHDINGDGRRMKEYYRGMLLALSELKREGISVEMNAWNLAEDGNVSAVLADANAARCNVIFGPLYTKQVPELSHFCQQHNIRLVIPFSISGNDVQTCPNIYQVYQTQSDIDLATINNFLQLFVDAHPVFVDCNDASSRKGSFTNALRSTLENADIKYSITNVLNATDVFAKAFSKDKRNVVILNTGRSPELGQVIKQLDILTLMNPNIKVSLFGYNEWFMYAKVYKDKFKKYETYIPSTYDYNDAALAVKNVERLYSYYFGEPMQQAIPRFALTGYDQLMFFVKGINHDGDNFHGAAAQTYYQPVQTPYVFRKVANGGYQNRSFMLVKYK